jgi:hypothetical protein
MTREDLLAPIIKLDGTNTETYFRQTGRTTRMLEDAVRTATTGRLVLVLMKDDYCMNAAIEKVKAMPGKFSLTIENATHPKIRNKIDWDNLRVGLDYVHHQVFFDHEVLYFNDRYKHIFQAASKYDPKIEVRGNGLYFAGDPVLSVTDKASMRWQMLLAKICEEFQCNDKQAVNIYRGFFTLAAGGHTTANVEAVYEKYGIPK